MLCDGNSSWSPLATQTSDSDKVGLSARLKWPRLPPASARTLEVLKTGGPGIRHLQRDLPP
jgi:hypothetical protein